MLYHILWHMRLPIKPVYFISYMVNIDGRMLESMSPVLVIVEYCYNQCNFLNLFEWNFKTK